MSFILDVVAYVILIILTAIILCCLLYVVTTAPYVIAIPISLILAVWSLTRVLDKQQ